MNAFLLPISLSLPDEERFGVRTARITSIAAEMLPGIQEYCRTNHVEFLIARCDAADLATAQAMEQDDFQLMDTLVYYRRDLAALPEIPSGMGAIIRPVSDDEAETVQRSAAAIFKGYGGHYHADPRLDQTKCDEVYPSWAYRSCVSREVADHVLVAEVDGSLAGFCAIRLNDADEGEITLYGVLPTLQKRGIGRALVTGAMHWTAGQYASRIIISTQVTNFASQTVWVRLGFTPYQAYYTFHKWF